MTEAFSGAFWVGFIAALVVLGGIVLALARMGRLPASLDDRDGHYMRKELAKQVDALDATVRVLQADHVRDMARITQLEHELGEAKERIQYLEGRLSQYEDNDGRTSAVDVPLLAIFGPDKDIEKEDLAALRQARIPFRRIVDATKSLVSREFLRRREARDLYRWVHVGAHAGPDGVRLTDGLAGPEFWNEHLVDVEGVFLAGCEDIEVADWLIGRVNWVVSTMERVDSELTGRFTKVFWEAIACNKSARLAYREACRVAGTFAEYTDFREAKR